MGRSLGATGAQAATMSLYRIISKNLLNGEPGKKAKDKCDQRSSHIQIHVGGLSDSRIENRKARMER